MGKNIFGGVVAAAMLSAEKNNPRVPEDYIGEGGLLYCGKCNTPKQCKFKALGTEKIVFCLCDCKKREQERKMREEEKAKAAFKRQQIREGAFPDKETRRLTFEIDDGNNPDVSEFARKYAESFDPKNSEGLLFYGDCGTGKSFYAACIVNALIDRNFTAKFTSISEIERELWSANSKNEVYNYFSMLDLLVIDDLSVERDTPYMQEIVYNVVDMRSRRNKPMVITANFTPADIKNTQEQWQKRVFSRILGSCIPYAVVGSDRRREKGKNSYSEKINRILNYTKGV